MAVDIQQYLNIIKEESSGENVRDAIIACMNAINQDSSVRLKPLVLSGDLKKIKKKYQEAGYAYSYVSCNITAEVTDPQTGQTTTESSSSVENQVVTVDNDTEQKCEIYPETGKQIEKVVVDLDYIKGDRIGDLVLVDLNNPDSIDPDGNHMFVNDGYIAAKGIHFVGVDVDKVIGGHTGPDGTRWFDYKFWKKEAGSSGNTELSSGSYKGGTVPPQPTTLPTSTGQSFSGWNPPLGPYSKDIDFYPVFNIPVVGGDSITDSWETIIKNGKSSKYKIGDYKTLQIGICTAHRQWYNRNI